ncbi:hypothetical protein Patl1_26770 [Pistacia atlantica]|uniref:Uncharacterized protein n=1 Tax=Pistacia atlantica TaxID=434234 RepID=A0ACC1B466_9ROSI|nr:hypothetical protein Patl1_26770 [Pistacia atlantica]
MDLCILGNIVSTVNLDCKLDLKQIALQARNAEYNPKVRTGVKSEQQSKLAARKYARIIQKLGFPAKFKYEPELFLGLIDRMKQPKIVLLLFVSGKIVITGAKVRDETYTTFENIYPVLNEFSKAQQWYSIKKEEKLEVADNTHLNGGSTLGHKCLVQDVFSSESWC